jgi:hypothetical protein
MGANSEGQGVKSTLNLLPLSYRRLADIVQSSLPLELPVDMTLRSISGALLVSFFVSIFFQVLWIAAYMFFFLA